MNNHPETALDITADTYPVGNLLERPGKTARVLGVSYDRSKKDKVFKGYHCLITETRADGSVIERQGLLRKEDLQVAPERGGWKLRKMVIEAAPIETIPHANGDLSPEIDKNELVQTLPLRTALLIEKSEIARMDAVGAQHAAPSENEDLPLNKAEQPDENLPIRQIEFLQALVAKAPIVKNAATRMALRRYGYITPTEDWDAIEITEPGRKWLFRNNQMPTESKKEAGLTIADYEAMLDDVHCEYDDFVEQTKAQIAALQRDLETANALVASRDAQIDQLALSKQCAFKEADTAAARVDELTEQLAGALAAASPALRSGEGLGEGLLTAPVKQFDIVRDIKATELDKRERDGWQIQYMQFGDNGALNVVYFRIADARTPEPARATVATVGPHIIMQPVAQPVARASERAARDLADVLEVGRQVYNEAIANSPIPAFRPLSLSAGVQS